MGTDADVSDMAYLRARVRKSAAGQAKCDDGKEEDGHSPSSSSCSSMDNVRRTVQHTALQDNMDGEEGSHRHDRVDIKGEGAEEGAAYASAAEVERRGSHRTAGPHSRWALIVDLAAAL